MEKMMEEVMEVKKEGVIPKAVTSGLTGATLVALSSAIPLALDAGMIALCNFALCLVIAGAILKGGCCANELIGTAVVVSNIMVAMVLNTETMLPTQFYSLVGFAFVVWAALVQFKPTETKNSEGVAMA